MRLYEVLNGYQGNGMVHVLVIARDEAHARELARLEFEAARRPRHTASWSNPAGFHVDELCADVGEAWASDVRD